MSRRTSGMIFISISAFLYGTCYLSAAIFGSNITTWSSELFDSMLAYIGKGPVNLSKASLSIGIAFLVWAEIEEYHTAHKKNKSLMNTEDSQQ